MIRKNITVVVSCIVVSLNCCLAEDNEPATYTETWDEAANKYIKRCDPDPNGECDCQEKLDDPNNECVQVKIDLGRTRYSALTESIVLQLNELAPNAGLYSPEGIRVIAGCAVYSVSRERNSCESHKWVWLTSPAGISSKFTFADNESVGMPVASITAQKKERLSMVDAQGWATASDPAYFDYYPGDGSRWRFGAAELSPDYLQLVEHETPEGRVETKQDIGLEIIRDEEGVLRQVKTPAWLADFVVAGQDAYDLKLYPDDAAYISGAMTEEGYYEIVDGVSPETAWEFRNPAPGVMKDLQVTVVRGFGSSSQTWLYTYDEAVKDFTLAFPDNVKRVRKERFESDDGDTWSEVKSTLADDGTVVSSEARHYVSGTDGSVLVRVVKDPDGLALTKTYTYYEGGVLDGLHKLTVYPDGSWERFEYDDQGRETALIRPWKDASSDAPANECVVIRTCYDLIDPLDFLRVGDVRPRIVSKEICGIEVSRNYYAYPTNVLGQVQEIVERGAFQEASYGHAGNQRTTKTFYAQSADAHLIGRLATVVTSAGRIDSCNYEYGNYNSSTYAFIPDPDGGAWRETVTTSYGENSDVQITRSVRVWNEKGREVLNENYVEDGVSFALLTWKRFTYNISGKLIETVSSNGEIETRSWGANCCGVESETASDGITMVYGYNQLKQKISETEKGLSTNGVDDIVTLRTYDLNGRTLSTTVTNYASGLGYLISSNRYDAVGRVTNSIDRLGNSTVSSYNPDGSAVVTKPNGVVSERVQYLSGKTKVVTENDIVKTSYAYGVNADGTQWTLTAQGTLPVAIQSSDTRPVYADLEELDFPWSLSSNDMFGRTICKEKPGYGGTTLVTSNLYNNSSHLVSTIKYSVDSNNPVNPVILSKNLFDYSSDGQRKLSVLDLDLDGVIDLAGPDRVNGSISAYEKISNEWYHASYSMVYPETGVATVITTGIQRVQITGLGTQQGVDEVLVSLSQSTDIRGNTSISQSLVDRDDRITINLTTIPMSTLPSMQISANGLRTMSISSTAVTNTFAYDALGRQTGETDGRGNTSTTAYTDLGLVDYTEDAANNRTAYGYDFLGRRTSVTDALNNTGSTVYDDEGRVLATHGTSYPVAYEYDSQGRMIAMATTRNESLRNANLLSVLPPGETLSSFSTQSSALDITLWQYDNPTGLLKNKVYSDGHGPSYAYTPDGKLATRTWARGVTTDYTYALSGVLIEVDYSDSTPDITYTFDRLGRQLTATSSISTNTFVYLPTTLELDYEIQNGITIDRSNDTLGRNIGYELYDPVNPVNPSQKIIYGYSNLGRFSSVDSVRSDVTNNYLYSYLPGTDLVRGYVSTSSISTHQLSTVRAYEPNRNLISAMSNAWNNTLISSCDFTNDELGRRTVRSDYYINRGSTKVNSFAYNTFSEITNAIMGTGIYSYDYDPIGNRNQEITNSVATAYEANGLNQYTNITGGLVASPVYDLDGNLLQDSRFKYTWDAENRLIGLSNLVNGVVSSYAYDHQSRRIFKTVSSSSPFNLQISHFTYDGWNMICEQLSTNTSSFISHHSSLYVWGLDLSGSLQGAGGVGGLLSETVSTSLGDSTYLSLCDANGNITEYIDNNGFVVAHYEYDPFGVSQVESCTKAYDFKFRFSSKYLGLDSGLYYYGYRYYRPEIGRWSSRDRIEELGGNNIYATSLNNLVVFHDFRGLYIVEGDYNRLRKLMNDYTDQNGYGWTSGDYVCEVDNAKTSVKSVCDKSCPSDKRYSAKATAIMLYIVDNLEVHLPEWSNYNQASEAQKAAWDAMLAGLTVHENGHVDIYNSFNGSDPVNGYGSSCDETDAVNNAVASLTSEAEKMCNERIAQNMIAHQAYDMDTQGGVLQGATLPDITE